MKNLFFPTRNYTVEYERKVKKKFKMFEKKGKEGQKN